MRVRHLVNGLKSTSVILKKKMKIAITLQKVTLSLMWLKNEKWNGYLLKVECLLSKRVISTVNAQSEGCCRSKNTQLRMQRGTNRSTNE